MDKLEERSGAASNNTVMLYLAWLWVGIPLAWGVADTIKNATKLFQ
ncbi:MAG: hypothetical protein ABSE64_05905 [Vulcanimicrobiaceae bacterium]|jgi:hypothetical protein